MLPNVDLAEATQACSTSVCALLLRGWQWCPAQTNQPVPACREVAKAVKLGKAKSVVVAPNIDQIETEGGLDDLLGNILGQADQAGLPVVFALTRKKMGQVGCRASQI